MKADRSIDKPSARAWRLRAADRLLATLWARGLAPLPSLDPAELIAAAPGGPALPDRSGWRRRLEILCDELENSARLTPLGRTLAHGQLAAALRDRARLEGLWARHPEIAEQPLAPPVIIVGQMRSGTTRLQRLLACDPRLASTSFAESWNPVPSTAARFDDRVWRARVGLGLSRLLNPSFDTIHPSAARTADEQIGWYAISIYGSVFEAQWRVPAFAAAVENGDSVPVYREFRRILQTVSWLRGDDGSRPVVLKIPQFSQDLDAILTAFPDARLLRLDRNPATIVASSASLIRNQMELQSDAVDLRWIGQETLRKVALRERRTEAALCRSAAPRLRLDYQAMGADWAAEMARVYRFLRLPFTVAVRAGMARAQHGAKRHRLERHRYALADYGLTDTDVRAALADPQPEAIAAE